MVNLTFSISKSSTKTSNARNALLVPLFPMRRAIAEYDEIACLMRHASEACSCLFYQEATSTLACMWTLADLVAACCSVIFHHESPLLWRRVNDNVENMQVRDMGQIVEMRRVWTVVCGEVEVGSSLQKPCSSLGLWRQLLGYMNLVAGSTTTATTVYSRSR
jgi:hypothetical protein